MHSTVLVSLGKLFTVHGTLYTGLFQLFQPFWVLSSHRWSCTKHFTGIAWVSNTFIYIYVYIFWGKCTIFVFSSLLYALRRAWWCIFGVWCTDFLFPSLSSALFYLSIVGYLQYLGHRVSCVQTSDYIDRIILFREPGHCTVWFVLLFLFMFCRVWVFCLEKNKSWTMLSFILVKVFGFFASF